MTTLVAAIAISSVAAVTDIRSRRIPNWLTYSAMLLGVGHQAVLNGAHGVLFATGGLFLGLALLIGFYIAGGMGAGDVKLMGAVGALLGPREAFITFLFAALAGGVYATILLLARFHLTGTAVRLSTMFGSLKYGAGVTAADPNGGSGILNYGVCIAVGVILTALWDFYGGVEY